MYKKTRDALERGCVWLQAVMRIEGKSRASEAYKLYCVLDGLLSRDPKEPRKKVDTKRFTKCLYCGADCHEQFIVKDGVWQEAGLEKDSGIIHLSCFEYLLGRSVEYKDFKDCRLNGALLHIFARRFVA